MKKYYKPEKSPLFAAALNFFFWGIGYLYIEKKIEEAFYLISLYLVVCIFSFWFLSIAGLVSFAGFYWIVFWSLWVGIYIGYDAYKIGRVKR